LIAAGYSHFIELSPRPVLARELKQALKGSGHVLVPLPKELEESRGLLRTIEQIHGLESDESRLARARSASVRRFCFPLSAHSEPALVQRAKELAQHLRKATRDVASDLAYTLSSRRDHQQQRVSFVARNTGELADQLEAFEFGSPVRGLARGRAELTNGQVAFVFPGQGGQWLGMGRELTQVEPEFRRALQRVARVAHERHGRRLLDELSQASEEDLKRSRFVQPLIFAFQVAFAELWRSFGVEPAVVVGHSMGEVAAAHVSGVLSLEDAVDVICIRSRLLDRVSGRGAMLLTELEPAEAEALVAGRPAVAVAALNSPRSCVLSGAESALREVERELLAKTMFCRWVRVDVASHSPQVDELLVDLEHSLAHLRPRSAKVPFLSTVRGELLSGLELDAHYWVRNLRDPVRFAPVVGALLRQGHRRFLEISPHPVLLPALQQCAAGEHGGAGEHGAVLVTGCTRRDEPEHATLLATLGALHAHGASVRWDWVHRQGGQVELLPTLPFQRERYWIESEAQSPTARIERALEPSRSSPMQLPAMAHGAAESLLSTGAQAISGPHAATGARLSVPRLWLFHIDPARAPELAQHQLGEIPLLSASFWLEWALYGAGSILPEGSIDFQIEFKEALRLEGSGALEAQMMARELSPGKVGVWLHTRRLETDEWCEHVVFTGQAGPPGLLPARSEIDSSTDSGAWAQEECRLEGDALYKRLAQRGLHCGERLRVLTRLQLSPEGALGRVGVESASNNIRVPLALEAAWQALALCLPQRLDQYLVPSRIVRGRLWSGSDSARSNCAQLNSAAIVQARVLSGSTPANHTDTLRAAAPPTNVHAALAMLDDAGRPCLSLDHIELVPVPVSMFQARGGAGAGTASVHDARTDSVGTRTTTSAGASGAPNATPNFRELLRQAPSEAAQKALLLGHVRAALSIVLALEGSRIGSDTPFRDLGMTSLMGLELRNRLEGSLGLRFSAATIWNYPTLSRFCGYLAGQLDLRNRESAPQGESSARAPETTSTAAPTERDSEVESDLARELAALEQLLDSQSGNSHVSSGNV
ncbi:MAG TPA: acyltransferase domain-containing protein, partial [Polyangiaceae bacterium]|nr:acyltransferase domain-containing protein [Polyangiaceae bacterium]